MAKRTASVSGYLPCGAAVRSRHVCADAMLTNRTCEAPPQTPPAVGHSPHTKTALPFWKDTDPGHPLKKSQSPLGKLKISCYDAWQVA